MSFGMLGIVPTMTEEQMARKIAVDKKNMEQMGYGVSLPQNMLFGAMAGEGVSPAIQGKDYSFQDVRKANPRMDAAMQGFSTVSGVPVGVMDFTAEMTIDPVNALGSFLIKGPKKGVEFLTKGKRAGQALGSSPNVIPDFYSSPKEQLFPKGYTPESVEKALDAGEDVPEQAKKAYSAWSRANVDIAFVEKLESVYGKLPKGSKQMLKGLVDKMPSRVKGALKIMKENKDPKTTQQANEFLSTYFKGEGFKKWGGKSVGNALSELFNPVSSARYIETGLTSSNQKRINSLFNHEPQYHHVTGAPLNKTPKVMDREAVAQLQHAVYMAHRAGREDLPPLLQETLNQMSVGGFRKFNSGEFKKASGDIKITRNNQEYKVPDSITDALFEKAYKNWSMEEDDVATMVVRQPSGDSGNFSHDINFKARGVRLGRSIFGKNPDGFASPKELMQEYLDKGVDKKDIQIVDDGVLITTRATSNSYLEGGINIVDHVSLDGVSHTVISDMYDFLENVPIARKIEESLENTVWGITPPVPQDLKKSGTFKTSRSTKEDLGKLKQMTKEASPSVAQSVVEATKLGTKVVGAPVALGMLSKDDQE